MLGWREPRCLREVQETTQLAWTTGAGPLSDEHWTQPISLGFVLSGTNLSLGNIIELAQSPPHSNMLGSMPSTNSAGWAWESWSLLKMSRAGAGP